MAKYVLVECADSEINHSVYDNIENAVAALTECYNDICDTYDISEDDFLSSTISEDKMEAFAYVEFLPVYEKGYPAEHHVWSWKVLVV